MTDRLYYQDSYLREFTARVVDWAEEGRRVYLDRTAFYPSSGGQPFDIGAIGGVVVEDVIDEGERIAHVLAVPITVTDVMAQIDWTRRYDHMQQHTGQHLLSAVLEELFGTKTVSFHMGAEVSTIDVDALSISPVQLAAAEDRCAAVVAEARPVNVMFEDEASGLRKASAREGTLRIVSIDGIDRSACGGTHVRTTAEIGLVLTGRTEKVRQSTRIEFVCGRRALERARADRRRLTEISRALGSAIEKTPALVASLADKVKATEKERARLTFQLARVEGAALYARGERFVMQNGPIDEAMRARAQAFVNAADAETKAVFVAISDAPPLLLIAVSTGTGLHAGDLAKSQGGRGGGNATMAQVSLTDIAARDALVNAIRSATL